MASIHPESDDELLEEIEPDLISLSQYSPMFSSRFSSSPLTNSPNEEICDNEDLEKTVEIIKNRNYSSGKSDKNEETKDFTERSEKMNALDKSVSLEDLSIPHKPLYKRQSVRNREINTHSVSMQDLSVLPKFMKEVHTDLIDKNFQSSVATLASTPKSKDSGLAKSTSTLSVNSRFSQNQIQQYLQESTEESVLNKEIDISNIPHRILLQYIERQNMDLKEQKILLEKLQENYSILLMKYALAENRIDKLRFRKNDEMQDDSLSEKECFEEFDTHDDKQNVFSKSDHHSESQKPFYLNDNLENINSVPEENRNFSHKALNSVHEPKIVDTNFIGLYSSNEKQRSFANIKDEVEAPLENSFSKVERWQAHLESLKTEEESISKKSLNNEYDGKILSVVSKMESNSRISSQSRDFNNSVKQTVQEVKERSNQSDHEYHYIQPMSLTNNKIAEKKDSIPVLNLKFVDDDDDNSSSLCRHQTPAAENHKSKYSKMRHKNIFKEKKMQRELEEDKSNSSTSYYDLPSKLHPFPEVLQENSFFFSHYKDEIKSSTVVNLNKDLTKFTDERLITMKKKLPNEHKYCFSNDTNSGISLLNNREYVKTSREQQVDIFELLEKMESTIQHINGFSHLLLSKLVDKPP